MTRTRVNPPRLRPARRRRAVAWLAALLALAAPGALADPTAPADIDAPIEAGQDVDATRAAAVKAAYLYNFVNFERFRFVTWPDAALGEPEGPIIVGILGVDPFGPVIDRTFAGKRVGRHSIVVQRLGPWPSADADPVAARDLHDAARACHLLFIATSEMPDLRAILATIGRRPVLTVSDAEHFARAGGIVELALTRGRIGLRINRQAGESASLRMSSKLLSLASIVETVVEKDAEDPPR